ncbi:MAG: hypothetical protein J3K34DRAFT_520470 [Monoraphidium minutum]|nr:MAG: hypothetical protein J3K34DRAFT_520470 [Monoraphidium minutum]
MAATNLSVTSEVVGKVSLPAGAAPADTAAPGRRYTAHVSRPFYDTAPEIQELVRTVLGLYDTAAFSPAAPDKILSRFVYNASWDTPLLFARGTDRVRALARGFALPFWRVTATPRLVTVSMINEALGRIDGRIDVEGVVEFYPRLLWPLSALLPESVAVHASWSVVARGADDKIMSVTETMHNIPKLPYPVRAIAATAISTAALTVFP